MSGLIATCNSADDCISIICPYKNKEIHRINMNACEHGERLGPRRMAVSGKYLFCVNAYDSSVSVIDLETFKEVKALSVGAYPVALCACGQYVNICCGESDSIWTVDAGDLSVIQCVPCGKFPCTIAANSAGTLCAVGNMLTSDVWIMSLPELEPDFKFKLHGMPMFAAFDDHNGRILVTHTADYSYTSGGVSVYSSEDYSYVKSVSMGCMPGTLRISEDGMAYLVNSGGPWIYVLDCESCDIINRISVTGMIDDILVVDGRVYVSCLMDSKLMVFDKEGEKITDIEVGNEPRGIIYIE